jgi:hypothetical protein
MFKINRLRTEITSSEIENISELFGFDFNFEKGLNILAGQNSAGKTTVNSCIYYVLGMEELLGAQNDKSLDKSLREEFSITDIETGEYVNHKVLSSKIILEIEDDKENVVSLVRYIVSVTHKKTNIHVYDSTIDEINDAIDIQEYFVDARGNNSDINGFYSWFGNFIGFEIPYVSNTSTANNYSPLYLQTIFSSIFIEQTKGWSDFFATMPFFGIPRAKEKIVEFLLGLDELKTSTNRDVINEEKNDIIKEWNQTIKSIVFLEGQTNSSAINVPEELTVEISDIDKIRLVIRKSEEEKVLLSKEIESKESLLKDYNKKSTPKIKENRNKTLIDFQEQKDEYFQLVSYISNFEEKYSIEKSQFSNLKREVDNISAEIVKHINLKKVFDENIISKDGAYKCPTCFQKITSDLISNHNIKIPQLTIEQNINFLKSQKKMVESSEKNLGITISEKASLLLYLRDSLRKKENIIKSISKDLIADDRGFSEAEIVRKIQLEKEIESLKLVINSLDGIKLNLKALVNAYKVKIAALEKLDKSVENDKKQLDIFEKSYKKMLFDFLYSSNEDYRIAINRKPPFKYFPVYKKYNEDKTPQSIRINSSASDFVRNIWAYSLALMVDGRNHPGVVMFDEPGQHRTNLQSLKKLFEVCSKIKKKQIIIFTSIDKQLNNSEKIDIDVITSGINADDLNLIYLPSNLKAIRKLIN